MKKFRIAILGVAIFASGSIRAESIEAKMGKYLQRASGAQVNVDEASTLNLQGAGLLTGPSASIRYPVSEITLGANVTAPSFSAGCGGIDFNLGSIELLDSKNLVQQIRQIGMGMVPVAIMLGMQTVTPQLTSVLQEFQKKADQFTKMSIDSCEASKALVLGGLAEAGGKEIACIAYRVDKYGETRAVAQQECGKKYSENLNNQTKEDKDKNPEFATGNLTWYLMIKSGLYTSSDTESMQIMMNLLGTKIFRASPANSDVANNASLNTELSPLLNITSDTFDKIMAMYMGGGSEKGFVLNIQACADANFDDPYSCTTLTPMRAMKITSENTKIKVLDALKNILRYIETDKPYPQGWGDLEKTIVEESEVPIYRYLISLAAYSPGIAAHADTHLNTFADLYAKMIFMRNVNEIAKALHQTLDRQSLSNREVKLYGEKLQKVMEGISLRMNKNNEMMANQELISRRTEAFEKVLVNRVGNALMQSALFDGDE